MDAKLEEIPEPGVARDSVSFAMSDDPLGCIFASPPGNDSKGSITAMEDAFIALQPKVPAYGVENTRLKLVVEAV
ncbi:unnamed protein product [Linum trigynum]|uniref:Uncharacterized protein n=1 Tax=Linum trigynum TaxID=586398 RepID=A0AAV2DTL3_9ROSI